MNITISNVELKMAETTNRETKRKNTVPLVRFSWTLRRDDIALITNHGWLMGTDRVVQPPKVFSFGRRRVKIHELSTSLKNALRSALETIPEVLNHLGPEQQAGTIEVEDSPKVEI